MRPIQRLAVPLLTIILCLSASAQVAFGPDGQRVVSGGENGNVMLWDVQTGKLIWSVIPIDWEAEKRAEEEAQLEAKAAASLEAERKQKTRR